MSHRLRSVISKLSRFFWDAIRSEAGRSVGDIMSRRVRMIHELERASSMMNEYGVSERWFKDADVGV